MHTITDTEIVDAAKGLFTFDWPEMSWEDTEPDEARLYMERAYATLSAARKDCRK